MLKLPSWVLKAEVDNLLKKCFTPFQIQNLKGSKRFARRLKSSTELTCGHALHLRGIRIEHSSSKHDVTSQVEADVQHDK